MEATWELMQPGAKIVMTPVITLNFHFQPQIAQHVIKEMVCQVRSRPIDPNTNETRRRYIFWFHVERHTASILSSQQGACNYCMEYYSFK